MTSIPPFKFSPNTVLSDSVADFSRTQAENSLSVTEYEMTMEKIKKMPANGYTSPFLLSSENDNKVSVIFSPICIYNEDPATYFA
jgi:hypothetical protein